MSIVNKFFRHYKGNYYYVMNISLHTETLEELVNYRSLYSTEKYPYGQIWARPLSMWFEMVNNNPRFTEVELDAVPQDAYNQMMELEKSG